MYVLLRRPPRAQRGASDQAALGLQNTKSRPLSAVAALPSASTAMLPVQLLPRGPGAWIRCERYSMRHHDRRLRIEDRHRWRHWASLRGNGPVGRQLECCAQCGPSLSGRGHPGGGRPGRDVRRTLTLRASGPPPGGRRAAHWQRARPRRWTRASSRPGERKVRVEPLVLVKFTRETFERLANRRWRAGAEWRWSPPS